MGDVPEESDECGYGKELWVELQRVDLQTAAELMKGAAELVAICGSSINTARRTLGADD